MACDTVSETARTTEVVLTWKEREGWYLRCSRRGITLSQVSCPDYYPGPLSQVGGRPIKPVVWVAKTVSRTDSGDTSGPPELGSSWARIEGQPELCDMMIPEWPECA